MEDRKRYGGVIDKVLNSKVSDMTISNIYKNIDLGKIDYIHINQSNKIDSILEILYVFKWMIHFKPCYTIKPKKNLKNIY